MSGTPDPASLTGSRSGQTTLNTESEGSLGTSWQTARRPLDMTLPPYGVGLDQGASLARELPGGTSPSRPATRIPTDRQPPQRFRGWFPAGVHSPRRPGPLWVVLKVLLSREPVGLVSGTFEQLEDSRPVRLRRCRTAGNIFGRSTWPCAVALSSGRRWECAAALPCRFWRVLLCAQSHSDGLFGRVRSWRR